VLPIAVLLGQLPPGTLTPSQPTLTALEPNADVVVPLAPLSIDSNEGLGDAPLPDDADIPIPLSLISLSDALAPVIVPATIMGERVNLRNGPGTEYDVVQRLSGDAPLQVIGRYNDWFQVRERADKPPVWISGELLNISEAAASTLFDVLQKDIPAPPPPKVGMVREAGLQLRDGPGTNYVPLTSLKVDTQLELIEIYQDWYHVGIPGSYDGWVKGEFLSIDTGIVQRLLVAETIPDPNPALIGRVVDNKVNLRKGPDSRYSKVGMVNADIQFDLIGKYKDWVRVRLPDGTKAWVFGDLVSASAHVMRRVPVSKDFPALPVAVSRNSGNSPGLANIKASGDVASFAVQFVGYRYRWGGASPSRGFDCSGLTSYVYAQYGVRLPRTAASQYSTGVGARVGSLDSLAPGDLVFFANTGGRRGISHVGIYIGGGRLVHAMTPRYGVQVSNIYDRYWSSHFAGGIRPRR
jgi:SH3-like domain-containing protein